MSAFAVGLCVVDFMGGGPGEKSDSSPEVQFGVGAGVVAESLSICLPNFNDERGFFAHKVCDVKIL
jgi:hypothetical protein